MTIVDERERLLAAAHSVSETVRQHAAEAEAQRRLPAPVVEALVEPGLLRLLVPEAYGGPGADPITLIEVIEAIAAADGAAGWCTMIASTTSSLAAFLEPAAAREIYGDPRAVTGGVFAPNATGVREGDGYRVTGRWQWGSGTQHCAWVLGGTSCDDGTFRLCFAPANEVTYHDTWYSSGMRGSGSLDFSFDGVWIPASHTMQPGITPPVIDTPLARFPNFTLLAVGVASVGLGVARRALDELIALASAKTPQFSTRTLAQSAHAQIETARAEASLRAARALLIDEVGTGWQIARAGGDVSLEQRVAIRLAATHVASTAASVADTAFTLAGGTAVYETSPLGRCLRDAHVVTQHIMTAPKLNETLGRSLLGLTIDGAML